jgi:hypothetical protein
MRAETKAPEGAVFAYSNLIGLFASLPQGLLSLAVGLLGVVLARWVFVNREQRRSGRRERWSETLPVTLIAMLIVGVLINDRTLSLSAAAFLGLGVGWVTVLLLDIFGDRIIAALRAGLGVGPASPKFPKAADLSGHGGNLQSSDVDMPDDLADLVGELHNIEERRGD